MAKKLDLSGKLDFSDIDLTAPEIVIQEILSQLPEETNNLILGKITGYDGPVHSYKKAGFSAIAAALGSVDREVSIQENLGEQGAEEHKFECFLFTPEYQTYRFRLFFVKYGVSNYPVEIISEQSIARSISNANSGYIFTCNTRDELEELVVSILSSERVLSVMQELVRISQSKRQDGDNLEDNDDATGE